MSFKTRLSVLLISTPVLAFVLVGGLMGKAAADAGQTFQHLRVFEDVVSLVMSQLRRRREGRPGDGRGHARPGRRARSRQRVSDGQARSGSRDPALPDGDVGIELTRQYYLRVIAARDGSPAAKAGLQTGDYVRAIDGKPTRDLSVFEGTRLLRGAAGIEGRAHGHSRQRRGAARDHAGARKARRRLRSRARCSAPDIGYVRDRRLQRRTADGSEARRPTSCQKAGAKSLMIDMRRTAEGHTRRRHRGGAALREVRHAGVQAGRAKDPKAEAPNGSAARRGRRRDRRFRSSCW